MSSSSTRGAAITTCSKLSSTSKKDVSRSTLFICSIIDCDPLSCIPKAWAMVGSTSIGSPIEARETKHTPPIKCSRIVLAICILRRVLPTPPGPSRVSRCTLVRLSRLDTVTISCSRPINEEKGCGIFQIYSGVCLLSEGSGGASGCWVCSSNLALTRPSSSALFPKRCVSF